MRIRLYVNSVLHFSLLLLSPVCFVVCLSLLKFSFRLWRYDAIGFYGFLLEG